MAVFFSIALLVITLFSLPAAALSTEVAHLRPSLSIYLDNKGVGLRHPEGVACSGSTLVVGDTENGRLVRYTIEGKSVKGGTEIKIPQLGSPTRVQIDSKGDIFALDGKERRIVHLGPDGAFKGYVAAEGAPSQSSLVPRSFKIGPDDALYILDVFSGRVLVVGADGKYQRQIDFPADYGFFSDVAVDAKGTVIVVDSIRATVWAAVGKATTFSPLGRPVKEYMTFPASLAADRRGIIYITDEYGGDVGILARDGSFLGKQLGMGWNEGLLSFPTQICVDDQEEVFIADRGNSRVQVFTLAK
jgi:sugar lactone lactonase YvrE